MIGYVNSFQSMGAVDGPGLRTVVFLQGCPLRCAYCHNPETWEMSGGEEYSPEEMFKKIRRFKTYFGDKGGVTLSGGEPLLQAEFAAELFRLCKNDGINTALDTAGSVWNKDVEKLLSFTDLVILDCKMTNEADYKSYIHGDFSKPLSFMRELSARKIKTWVRQVIVPDINDNEENIRLLKQFAAINPLNERIELLPLHKLCIPKYENLGILFPLTNTPEPTTEKMNWLNSLLVDNT